MYKGLNVTTCDIAELLKEYNEAIKEITAIRKSFEKFLAENPNHTFRPEVSFEINEKIDKISKEADRITVLIQDCENANIARNTLWYSSQYNQIEG